MAVHTNRLMEFLDNAGVEYEVIAHRPDYSAQKTAADTHTPGRAFAKSVLLRIGGSFALAVLPANDRVNRLKISQAVHAPVVLAEERDIAHLFPDCEIGAESPFGNLYGVDVYVSPALADDEFITFNAGTHTEVIRMRYADFAKLAGVRQMSVGQTD